MTKSKCLAQRVPVVEVLIFFSTNLFQYRTRQEEETTAIGRFH